MTEFEDAPTADLPPERDPGPRSRGLSYKAGDRIDQYTIRRRLGEGGMGAVFEAEQTEPVRRTVALKLIKPGMDSEAVIARFEAERQALAVMDHPSIATIHDGGTTKQGLPFFVMEYVKGLPITDHCDRNRLTLNERLSLVIGVCDAIRHAHSKGVIHRDLKPSNILVEYTNGIATPMVIDFGVAKALNTSLTDESLHTEQGQMIGTPEYMSPEQADLNAQDVDTRSDVYSIGVILYELLAGTRPFETGDAPKALIEIQQLILEAEPDKPSTALSSIAQAQGEGTAAAIASARRSDVRQLTRTLKRDLDWVVMKCLEKDRERRYETINALTMDLERFMSGLPVHAGPPSVAYRVEKFVRRNRGAVTAAAIVAGALLLGIAGTTTALLVAIDREREASAQAIEANEQRDRAEARAQELTAVLDTLDDMLRSVQAEGGASVSVKQMLDGHAARVRSLDSSFPRAAGRVRQTLSLAYYGLDEYESSLEHATASNALLCQPRAGSSLHDAERLECYAARLHEIGVSARLGAELYEQGQWSSGKPIADRAFAECEALLAEVESDDAASAILPFVLYRYGRLMQDPIPVEEAIAAFERSEALAEAVDTSTVPAIILSPTGEVRDIGLESRGRIGQAYAYAHRYDQAEPVYMDMLELVRARYGVQSEQFTRQLGYCNWLYQRMDRPEIALGYSVLAVRVGRTLYRPHDVQMLKLLDGASDAYGSIGRHREAAWTRAEQLRQNLVLQGIESKYSTNGERSLKRHAREAGIGSRFERSISAFNNGDTQGVIDALTSAIRLEFGVDSIDAVLDLDEPPNGDAGRSLARWQRNVQDAIGGDG